MPGEGVVIKEEKECRIKRGHAETFEVNDILYHKFSDGFPELYIH